MRVIQRTSLNAHSRKRYWAPLRRPGTAALVSGPEYARRSQSPPLPSSRSSRYLHRIPMPDVVYGQVSTACRT